jgi:hypothetical protein
MSSTLKDALAQLIISDAVTFASLPLPLARLIFLALPPDARGRASCVCRAWRDVLAEPALWTRLEMPEDAEGDYAAMRLRALRVVHGAAGRAHGELRQLVLLQHYFSQDELLPVLTSNAGSLRELQVSSVLEDDTDFEAIVAAAPLLQVLRVEGVSCTWKDAPRMLRAEPPFAPLQMGEGLYVRFDDQNDLRAGGMERFGPFAAALANVTLQPALLRLGIELADVSQPAAMEALADAALARRLCELTLHYCTPPAAAPLARLLAGGSLTGLEIMDTLHEPGAIGPPLFDAAGAALVADALRVNTTLTVLQLHTTFLYEDTRAGELVLGALAGHPSLRELSILELESEVPDRSAFGGALAALIAADAPALEVLHCSSYYLGDDALTPIVQALPLNHHLRELDMSENSMSEALARERLLPAVRANTTLRKFTCANAIDDEPAPALAEAEELVRLRGQHA